ncbi:MAG TPA: OsmC family protein [Gemmatimonadales bacterium]|nr:OsmC family protein [Gemmatimonadales bacterium]
MTSPQNMSPSMGEPDDEAGEWVVASIGPRGFRTELAARGHALVADEPARVGGTDAGPTPYELLLAALGGCTVITLRMYADRKGWPLEGAEVRLRTARSHELDCERCETEPVGLAHIARRVVLTGPLTDEQRARLLQIADRCPVKQTLERGMRVVAEAGRP